MMRTITPFLSIVIAVLLFLFFTQPRYTKIQDIRSEINEYVTAKEQYEEFSTKLNKKLSVMQGRTVDENNRLASLAPVNLDDTQLLVDIERMVNAENMLVSKISIDGGEKFKQDSDEQGSSATSLEAIDVSLSVIGTYEQFKSLLKIFEKSLTLLEIVKISFKSDDDSVFQMFDLTIRAYTIQDN